MGTSTRHSGGDWGRFFEAIHDELLAAWLERVGDRPALLAVADDFPRRRQRRIIDRGITLFGQGMIAGFTPAHHIKIQEHLLREGFLEAFALQDIGGAYLVFLDLVTDRIPTVFRRKSPERREALRREITRVLFENFVRVASARVAVEQQQLQQSEDRFRTMIEHAGNPIVLADGRTGRIQYANAEALRVYGDADARLVGKGIEDLLPPRAQQTAVRMLAEMNEEGDAAAVTITLPALRASGKTFPAEITAVRLERRDGPQIVAVARDVSEAHARTDALRAHTRQLARLNAIGRAMTASFDPHEILRRILESARAVVPCGAASLLLRREDGRLAFHEALGPRGTAVKQFMLEPGRGLAGWVVAHGETANVADAHADERFDTEIETAVKFPVRTVLCVPLCTEERTLGALELLNRRGGAFSEEDVELAEAFAAFAAIALDKARLFQDRATLREQLLQAEAATHAGRLASTIAQEMIDPLTILKNHVTILQQRPGADASTVDIVQEELTRLQSIVRQLVDYSNSTAEVARPTPLALLVADVVASLRPEIDAAGVTLQVQHPKALPPVTAVPTQAALALTNLIRRAVAVTPRGGTAQVRLRRRGAGVLVSVADEGPALTRQQIDTVFDPTAVQRGILAKGLDLYIASAIVRHQGAELRGRGRREAGTTFTFVLPAAQAEDEHG